MQFFTKACLFLFAIKTVILQSEARGSIKFSCNDHGWLFVNGKHVKDVHGRDRVSFWQGDLEDGDVVMIKGLDDGGNYGCTALIEYRDGSDKTRVSNSKYWRALRVGGPERAALGDIPEFLKKNPISKWPAASKGTSGIRVHRDCDRIWGAYSGGMALMATTLGSGQVVTTSGGRLPTGSIKFSCNDHGWLFVNGKNVKDVHGSDRVSFWKGDLEDGDTVMIKGLDTGGNYGCTALIEYRDGRDKTRVSNSKYWRALPVGGPERAALGDIPEFLKKNPISKWPAASKGTGGVEMHRDCDRIWGGKAGGMALMATTLGSGQIAITGGPLPPVGSRPTGSIKFSCDDKGWLFINGKHVKDVHGYKNVAVWNGELEDGDIVLIKGLDTGGKYGCTALIEYRDGRDKTRVSNSKYWRALPVGGPERAALGSISEFLKKNPISKWPAASKGTGGVEMHRDCDRIWGGKAGGMALMATRLW